MACESAAIAEQTLHSSPPAPQPLHVRHRLWILLLITLLSAAGRFATLDRPPLHGDEALTFSRVIGSFHDMLAILRYDGFMPLNYVLYWWLGHGLPIGPVRLAPDLVLTPAVMRIIPALCGTLMIPAMYFAARQITTVRASLLAAAFTCVSAYLMAYSHNAKMYIQTWLFVTLNLGCVWWWLRTKKRVAWLAWVATGIAAVGFHIAAVLMIAPQPIFLFTRGRLRWREPLLMLGGLLIIAAGPWLYYGWFNQWHEVSGGILQRETGDWNQSGVAWVQERNQAATGPQLLREAFSAYLIGTEWTDTDSRPHRIDPRVTRIVAYVFLWNLAFLIVAAWPQRTAGRLQESSEPWWRTLLWLSVLLVLPVYGFFYCRSVHDFVSPLGWLMWLGPADLLVAVPVAVALWYYSGQTDHERREKVVRFALVAAAVVGLCSILYFFWRYQYARHRADWMSLWMPRYIGVVWPAMGIAVAILLMRVPGWFIRWPAIVLLLSVNAVNATIRLAVETHPPHDAIFSDIVRVRDDASQTRIIISTLDPSRRGVYPWLRSSNYGLYGHAGRYYACMRLGLKPTPREFREGDMVAAYEKYAGNLVMPAQIPAQLRWDRRTRRLIIWERYREDCAPPEQLPKDDAILQALGPSWKLAGEPRIFRMRSWHEWSDMGWLRRREYARAQ